MLLFFRPFCRPKRARNFNKMYRRISGSSGIQLVLMWYQKINQASEIQNVPKKSEKKFLQYSPKHNFNFCSLMFLLLVGASANGVGWCTENIFVTAAAVFLPCRLSTSSSACSTWQRALYCSIYGMLSLPPPHETTSRRQVSKMRICKKLSYTMPEIVSTVKRRYLRTKYH